MDPALDHRQTSDRRNNDRRHGSAATGGRRTGDRRRFDRRRVAAGAGLVAALAFGGVRAHQRLGPATEQGPIALGEDELDLAPEELEDTEGLDEEEIEGTEEEIDALDQRRQALEPYIQAAAQEYNVSPDLVRAVVQTESQFNPRARSGAGAIGAMQLMPRTARSIGIANPLDPRENIFGGTKYLSTLLERFKGNTALALAGYNAGPTLVARHGRVPPIRETQNYVKKIHKLVADTDAAFHLPASYTPPRRASLRSSKAAKTYRVKARSAKAAKPAKASRKKETVRKKATSAKAKRAASKATARRSARGRRA